MSFFLSNKKGPRLRAFVHPLAIKQDECWKPEGLFYPESLQS